MVVITPVDVFLFSIADDVVLSCSTEVACIVLDELFLLVLKFVLLLFAEVAEVFVVTLDVSLVRSLDDIIIPLAAVVAGDDFFLLLPPLATVFQVLSLSISVIILICSSSEGKSLFHAFLSTDTPLTAPLVLCGLVAVAGASSKVSSKDTLPCFVAGSTDLVAAISGLLQALVDGTCEGPRPFFAGLPSASLAVRSCFSSKVRLSFSACSRNIFFSSFFCLFCLCFLDCGSGATFEAFGCLAGWGFAGSVIRRIDGPFDAGSSMSETSLLEGGDICVAGRSGDTAGDRSSSASAPVVDEAVEMFCVFAGPVALVAEPFMTCGVASLGFPCFLVFLFSF